MSRPIPRELARAVKLVILDIDGVMTDGGLMHSSVARSLLSVTELPIAIRMKDGAGAERIVKSLRYPCKITE